MQVIHRDSMINHIREGVKEHCLVMKPKRARKVIKGGSECGLSNLIYMSDTQYDNFRETEIPQATEYDVLSILIEAGSSDNIRPASGQDTSPYDVRVSPSSDNSSPSVKAHPSVNRIIQLWLRPNNKDRKLSCNHYQPSQGKISRVYGDDSAAHKGNDSNTTVDIALIHRNELLT